MKRKRLIMICSIISIILLCCIGFNVLKKHQDKIMEAERTSLDSVREEVIENAAGETLDETITSESHEEDLSIPEEITQPQPVIQEPVMTDPVIPKDIYVLKDGEGKIKSYYEDVEEYIWEYYDEDEKSWKLVSENENIHLTGEMDELNRSISVLKIKGIDINNGLLVRCKIKLRDQEEEITHQAAFHLLDFSKDSIKNLAVSEDFQSEAGTYVDVLDIPIIVIKKDDSEMEVTGLNDLFFYMPKEVSSDTEKNPDGMTVETVTTTSIEKEYHQITAGENKIILRYRGTVPGIDVDTTLIGTDSLPPEVAVQLSDYSIGNTKKTENTDIKATINAKDNYSPITRLLYAFKNKEDPVEDEDFSRNNIFDIKVDQNGIWTAYVKDEIGNIAAEDIEIIIVDQKAPVIESVVLKDQEDGWRKDNIICVTAEDKTDMKYCYVCEADNIDSGWIDESEYEITQNGLWIVKVKDAAGNENHEEVTITNVDNQPPIILSVKPKNINEADDMVQIGTLEERVDVTVKGADVKETSSDYDVNNSYAGSSYRSGETVNKTDSMPGSYYPSNNTSVSTAKGEKGERGAAGAAGTAGAAGKDGASSYLHIKYSESPTGNNMSGSPADSSKYIGIYTGDSASAPSSASSYQWSLYKGSNSHIYIRYADNADGANMTEIPKDEDSYIGICSSADSIAPDNPQSYIWSKYKDDKAIIELQNNMEVLQKQIDELKTPTP